MIWKILFFLPTVVFVFWEIYKFKNANEINSTYSTYKEARAKHAISGGPKPEVTDVEGLPLIIGMEFLYFLWVFIGLFSSQWVAFLFIFIISFIPKPMIWIKKADSLVTGIVLIFILLNAFHLHINLFTEFKSWIYG